MKEIPVQTHTPASSPAWLQVSGRHRSVPVFASAKWLEILSEVFRFQAQILTAHATSGAGIAIPLLSRQRFFLRVSPAPPITLYNGFQTTLPPTTDKQRRQLIAPTESILREISAHYHFASLSLPVDCPVIDVFHRFRWQLLKQRTIVIPMTDHEAVWAGYSQSLRRKIRRADEQQLRLAETEDIDCVVALHETSYQRHGIMPPVPKIQLLDWMRRLKAENFLRMFTAALPNGKVVAVRVVIPDHNSIYDWLAGADVGATDISASHWLVANIHRRFMELGYTSFDFMGANTPGVAEFKRSFGGMEVPFHIATYYRSPMVKTVESLRNSLRRKRRRLR